MYDAIILCTGDATRLQINKQHIRLKPFQVINDKSLISHIFDNILKTNLNNIYICF